MPVSRDSDPSTLFEAARAGDRVALARLLSMVERGGEDARLVAGLAYKSPGEAYTMGITGAPGAGKSTLTDRLVAMGRKRGLDGGAGGAVGEAGAGGADGAGGAGGEAGAGGAGGAGGADGAPDGGPDEAGGGQVGVLAIDPSSPFSGGAILGDRVRMQNHALDEGVFIRSMATRGHLGGLAVAVPDAIRVLSAVGMPVVIVETVGVGQQEVEVAAATDSTVVVVNPGWGDSIQANKAGLLEIADLFVINKADRPGAQQTRRDLEAMLDLTDLGEWRPPIVETVASTGDGVDELWKAIERHRQHQIESGLLAAARQRRLLREFDQILVARVKQQIEEVMAADQFADITEALASGDLDPYEAVDRVLAAIVPTDGRPVSRPVRRPGRRAKN